jgi:hypothetical protein
MLLCWFVVLADVPAHVPCRAHALLLPCRAGRRLAVVRVVLIFLVYIIIKNLIGS